VVRWRDTCFKVGKATLKHSKPPIISNKVALFSNSTVLSQINLTWTDNITFYFDIEKLTCQRFQAGVKPFWTLQYHPHVEKHLFELADVDGIVKYIFFAINVTTGYFFSRVSNALLIYEFLFRIIFVMICIRRIIRINKL